jgi:hypothetical protein
MASNTQILIRRSLSSNTPSSLLQGELAYSYSSNTLYIGSPAGTGALEIGSWSNLTNLTPGTYGSSTQVPVIQVDSHGKVTNVTTQAISTTLALSGDNSTTNTMSLLTGTLNFNGGQGITTAVLDSTANVTFNVDDTVVRANASYVGPQTINTALTIGANNDLTVTGNLFVFGNTTTFAVDQLEIADPLILLGIGNYYSDTFDIGFASHYNDGSNAHTGLIRDAGTKEYHFFKGYTPILDANNNINLNDPSYQEANVYASYFKGNVIADTAVANGFYGTLSTNLMYLYPSETYENTDQYIVLDPTAPNHIHVRAGGNIDASTAELYLGGEQTNVNVSDTGKAVYIRANNIHVSTFDDDGSLTVPNTITSTNGNIVSGAKVLAAQGAGSAGGFSFTGTEGGSDSGMFSPADGEVHLYANNIDVVEYDQNGFEIKKPTYLTAINKAATLNVVYYNASTGELTYDVDNSLTPSQIANGAYSLYISDTDGMLITNGAGLQLANGAIIKDTSGDAVAFGQNAGGITQGVQAVAIGDSAGYNNQGAYGVAVGYGAGNVNQGTTAVAIGINAGVTNQGAYGIAIGNSAGSSQGQYGIALGYDTGGSQGVDSIAIGTQAGKGNTSAIGANSILIGKKAGFESAAAGSIVLNGTGNTLNASNTGFYVSPVRYMASQDPVDDGFVYYNQTTKEFRYSYQLDGGSF